MKSFYYLKLSSLLLQLITTWKLVVGYKWFAMYQYDDQNNCNSFTLEKIYLTQANKCTQVNAKGVISSYSTDCYKVGDVIFRTMSNWTNGYCSGNFEYNAPYDNNITYHNNLCYNGNNYPTFPAGTKYECVEDPEFETWPGQGLYDPNEYSDCSPYYGPNFIWAYPPTCMNVTTGTKSMKYQCSLNTLNEITYTSSSNCSNKASTSTKNHNLDECLQSTFNNYYSCPLTILPGVAFLAIGNQQVGSKVLNKVFVGGIFSVVLICTFLVLLGLVMLFYYRRVYRPLKKLIMELANNNEEVSRESQKQALENVGAGSFCAWLCGCGKIDTEAIKKLAE